MVGRDAKDTGQGEGVVKCKNNNMLMNLPRVQLG